jgi:hypothetical protein
MNPSKVPYVAHPIKIITRKRTAPTNPIKASISAIYLKGIAKMK